MSNPNYFDGRYVPAEETRESAPPESEGRRLRKAISIGADPEPARYERAKPTRRIFKARLIED